jgi:hypothetical protein
MLMLTLRTSTDILDDVEALRSRLAADGYLYLPGLLDRDEVAAVQADLRAALWAAGWLAGPDSLAMADPGRQFTPASFATVYPAVLRVESFHRLAFAAPLWTFMQRFLGEPIFCHPARIARMVMPSADPAGYATRAHQDYVTQHVTTDALTAWFPFATCDARRQGLRLIPGSQHGGFQRTDPTLGGRRPLYLPVDPDDERWATADYQPGDVVVFHSLTVHGGGPNTSDAVRLSGDVRYQRCSDPLRAEYAHPHGWPVTPDWPELAADWDSHAWYELSPDVELVELPPNIDYGAYLAQLQAPPSRLLLS